MESADGASSELASDSLKFVASQPALYCFVASLMRCCTAGDQTGPANCFAQHTLLLVYYSNRSPYPYYSDETILYHIISYYSSNILHLIPIKFQSKLCFRPGPTCSAQRTETTTADGPGMMSRTQQRPRGTITESDICRFFFSDRVRSLS